MAENRAGSVPLDTPGAASAEQGHVVLDGPDGVAITLTPAAAEGTADSLMRAAQEARRQHH